MASNPHLPNSTPQAFVRNVEFRHVPESKELAARVRHLGDEVYPKIVSLLLVDSSRAPKQFDIIFQRKAPLDSPAVSGGAKIRFGTHWFIRNPDNLRDLDLILVHEIAHIAQQYRKTKVPFFWTEGVADYARFKLGYTNAWNCVECSEIYPHYTSGYGCAGAFLCYLDITYGSNVVRNLNKELHQATYTDEFFSKATGKDLPTLWNEFQKTPAYRPAAADAHELQQALGYVNGRPPKNLNAKFEAFVRNQPGGELTLDAEKFLHSLRKNGKLPGFSKAEPVWMYRGEHGRMPFRIPRGVDPQGFPAKRYFFFYKTTDDPSAYQYTLERESEASPWRLKKAWRTAPDGHIIETYTPPLQPPAKEND